MRHYALRFTILVFSILTLPGTSGAEVLYRYAKANLRYTVSRTADGVTLSTDGMSYRLRASGCVARQARDLTRVAHAEFLQLPKIGRGRTPASRVGTVAAGGDVRALNHYQPFGTPRQFFEVLPRRFINLYTQEQTKCLRFFK